MAKGLNQPQVFRVASIVADSASANTGNLRTAALTATARAIPISDCCSLILSVTSLTGISVARLNVYLEHSWDGGSNWAVAEAFLVVTTSTDVQTITFRSTGLGANEAAVRNSTTTGTNAVIAQNIVLAPDQRIAWTLSDTGAGAEPSATFTVNAICQPFGTAGV